MNRTPQLDLPLWGLIALFNWSVLVMAYSSAGVLLDYSAFYFAGRSALTNPHSLYDPTLQAGMPFYHLPTEALIFAPLSLLSYEWSLLAWRLLQLLCMFGSAWMLSKVSDVKLLPLALKFLAFCPVVLCFCAGQDSALLLLILSTSLYLLNSERPVMAGIVLALAIFKPQIPLVAMFALLVAGYWRAFLAFAATSLASLTASLAIFGLNWYADLSRLIQSHEPTEDATRMLSIHGLLASFRIDGVGASIVSLLLVMCMCYYWRQSRDVKFIFSTAVLVGSLTAFHFHIYDATVALIPITLLVTKSRWATMPLYFAPVVMAVSLVSLNWMALPLIACLVVIISNKSATSFALIQRPDCT